MSENSELLEQTPEKVIEDAVESSSEEKSIIIASDLFPEQLLIVPLYDRPLFPKMMLPVIISDEDFPIPTSTREPVIART